MFDPGRGINQTYYNNGSGPYSYIKYQILIRALYKGLNKAERKGRSR